MEVTPEARAARLLDRIGALGLHKAAAVEVSDQMSGRDLLAMVTERAVRGVPTRWRAVADALDPTSTMRVVLHAAADELEATVEEREDRAESVSHGAVTLAVVAV